MHKRVLTAATITGVVACLALTGCGGDKSQPKAKIPDETASASASPSPTASTPTFKLPADVKVTIEPDLTGDPVKDAILRDNGYLITALFQALTGGGPNDKAYQAYAKGAAVVGHFNELSKYRERARTVTGPTHFYKRRVTLLNPTKARITYCEDQRESYDKEIETGKVILIKASPQSFVRYYSELERDPDGVWRETFYRWSKGAQECRTS